MEKIEHKIIPVNGLNMHVAELGEGPLVLFLHGFPELWYSWRHQILYLAGQGYRAVAPDLRGYGDTSGAPVEDPSKFTSLHLVGDLIALLDAIAPDADKVFLVGHDWGAYIAWQLCLYRPDKVKALVNLSVAFIPRTPEMSHVEMFRSLYGDDHYICRFQGKDVGAPKVGVQPFFLESWPCVHAEHSLVLKPSARWVLPTEEDSTLILSMVWNLDPLPTICVYDGYHLGFHAQIMRKRTNLDIQEPGDIEAEFMHIGTKQVLKNFLAFRTPGPFYFPKGKGFGYSADKPAWLSEDDLNYYAEKFEQTGFSGGVNYYRAFDRNWELNAPWSGAQVKVPAKFVVGEFDLTYHVPGIKEFIHNGGFQKCVPLLKEVVVIEGAAHFINQERPDEISQHIHDFLKQF